MEDGGGNANLWNIENNHFSPKIAKMVMINSNIINGMNKINPLSSLNGGIQKMHQTFSGENFGDNVAIHPRIKRKSNLEPLCSTTTRQKAIFSNSNQLISNYNLNFSNDLKFSTLGNNSFASPHLYDKNRLQNLPFSNIFQPKTINGNLIPNQTNLYPNVITQKFLLNHLPTKPALSQSILPHNTFPLNMGINKDVPTSQKLNKTPLQNLNYIITNTKPNYNMPNFNSHDKIIPMIQNNMPSAHNQYVLIQTSNGPTLIPITHFKSNTNMKHIVHQNKINNAPSHTNLLYKNISTPAPLLPNNSIRSNLSPVCLPHQVLCEQKNLMPLIAINGHISLEKHAKNANLSITNSHPMQSVYNQNNTDYVNSSKRNDIKPYIPFIKNSISISTVEKNYVILDNNKFISTIKLDDNIDLSLISNTTPKLKKINRYAAKLAIEQETVINPKIDKFVLNDTIAHLLSYHVYYKDAQNLTDTEEKVYHNMIKGLLYQKIVLFQKYQQLFWENCMKQNDTLEDILLNRLWLATEKESLARDRQSCQKDGPEKIFEIIGKPYQKVPRVSKSLELSKEPQTVIDLKTNPNLLGNLINDAIFEDATLEPNQTLESNGGINPDYISEKFSPYFTIESDLKHPDTQTEVAINSILKYDGAPLESREIYPQIGANRYHPSHHRSRSISKSSKDPFYDPDFVPVDSEIKVDLVQGNDKININGFLHGPPPMSPQPPHGKFGLNTLSEAHKLTSQGLMDKFGEDNFVTAIATHSTPKESIPMGDEISEDAHLKLYDMQPSCDSALEEAVNSILF